MSVKIDAMSVLESDPHAAAVTCCGLSASPVSPQDAARPELCVCEITPEFDLSSATISHHLKTLREAGLVDCERRGTFVYYWIRPEALGALSALLSPQHP